jgi:sugar phosphate permease
MMKISLYKSYSLWACASLFYLYQFVLRLSPSVMMEDLMEAFVIDATGFAALGSLALASYSFFQIPLGAFADTYGVRRCILLFLSLCVLGTFIFAIAPHLWMVQVGRFTIGLGSAAAFLCVSKIIAQEFSVEKRSTLLGFTMVVGTIGALNGGVPLCYVSERFGWSQCLLFLCVLGLILIAVSYCFLRFPHVVESTQKPSAVNSFKQILKNKECWVYAGTALGLYIAIAVLGDLWGVAFIMKAHGVERSTAVSIISCMYVGLCMGSLLITWLSDMIKKTKAFILMSTTLLLILLFLVIAPLPLPFILLYPLFFLIGFFAGAEMLCFSEACKVVCSSIAGITTGFLNGIVMMGGAFIQMGVGLILDSRWNGALAPEGIKLYATQDYRVALSLIFPILILALFSSLFITEKKSINL